MRSSVAFERGRKMAFGGSVLREFRIVVVVRRLDLRRCVISNLILCVALLSDGRENRDDDGFFHGCIEFEPVLARLWKNRFRRHTFSFCLQRIELGPHRIKCHRSGFIVALFVTRGRRLTAYLIRVQVTSAFLRPMHMAIPKSSFFDRTRMRSITAPSRSPPCGRSG